ncbi:hypothetical protein L0F63_000255 [Massospora cicadina]|nr:hypothetical protein L0F63_000255 [Massospora cicadina]
MGLSEDLTRLVTEAKNSRKLIRPYAGELVRKLIREMNVLYRSIETGFTPNVTQSLTQLSSTHVGLNQEPNSQASTSFVSSVGHLPSESAYTGMMTPQRTREVAKTYSPKANVTDTPLGKRQLAISSSASTPKRTRRFLSHDGDRESNSNQSQLTSTEGSNSPFRTPRRSSYRVGGSDVSSNLSPAEINFGTAYQLLIGSISAQFPLVDLLGSLEPPKEVYLEVRVIRDCGEILTNNGVISLEAGSQLFVRKADVEQLLINGDIKAI